MPDFSDQNERTERLDPGAVEAQLDLITESPEFDTSKRSVDFLRFVWLSVVDIAATEAEPG